MKKNILIIFGGTSSEHEVSIITGLQVLENIDKTLYNPTPIYISKDGLFFAIPSLKNRKKFLTQRRYICKLGKDKDGSYIEYGLLAKRTYIKGAYLALHSGTGEGGQIQGMLECLEIPYTSPTTESCVLGMNKSITKELLAYRNIKTIDWVTITDQEYLQNPDQITNQIIEKLNLPVIIKPVHLGSTIGISIAKTEIELKKYLSSATLLDQEVLIEKYLPNIVEYNISLKLVNNEIQYSEIEEPIHKDTILSFEDKYKNGSKKTGGMANLSRNLPAQITDELKSKIKDLATQTYKALRCSQMIRIDFILSEGTLYLCEVNEIPGSMAYYLWEAKGIQFKDQITEMIEESIKRNENILKKRFSYTTDIVEKFVSM